MDSSGLKARMRAGARLCGAFCSAPSPESVEIAAYAGFDFCVIDAEHGPISISDITAMLRAGHAAGIPMLVRVPQASVDFVLRPLDAGADGIIAPQIEERDQLEAVLAGTRYPPLGRRGLAFYTRAYRFGEITDPAATTAANERILTGILLETEKGIANADTIMTTEGLDFVLVGTTDLSSSYGFVEDVGERVDQAIARVVEQGKKNGVAVALPVGTSEATAACFERGASIVVTGLLPHFLCASRAFVSSCRAVMATAKE